VPAAGRLRVSVAVPAGAVFGSEHTLFERAWFLGIWIAEENRNSRQAKKNVVCSCLKGSPLLPACPSFRVRGENAAPVASH
jgi:hypothetical protein